ncbi:MAG: mechanosensitive ion channel [Edaphobacter sp.]|uniref:mechanosensitive ion channel family protein n=1 Tax=Edaphobacter sp. TaxID=1934404 RepID=UPI00239263B6|nr:mechanosensitive ion channel domain-containing protein [Edaphobacter sp.]MDE1178102.1 mechanosensitive ion channel [Edaphobacter sp.]
MANLPYLSGKGKAGGRATDNLVDQRSWQTIESLTPLAVSVEEKRLVHAAQRLADHEVDQAFAQALRQASMATRTLTGDALTVQQKVTMLQAIVKEDQGKADALAAASKGTKPPTNDEIDAAKAQIQLDNDELDDANEYLARMTGDKRGQIQQELTARQAAMKKFDEQNESVSAPSAVQSAKRYATLYGRISAWFDQRARMDSIAQAQAQATSDAKTLVTQHDDMEKQLAAGASSDTQGQSRVAQLAKLHSLAQIHGIIDDRVQTQNQLAMVYGRWHDQVERQHQIVMHLILQSIAAIGFILLCASILAALVRHLLGRMRLDRRNQHTLSTIASLSIQLVTLIMVLLVVFGVPDQMPTIIGLATAGITVVFQDFILAFFGWFILMGKNGIRVGDWVEINGVGGEVISLGLFRTALLETGNWTDKGHPTGRTVTFINNFAITGQYFNFSTSGQWLWDEIQVNIPAGPHTYQIIDSIHETVQQASEDEAKQAESEWQKATGSMHGLSHFSVAPTVDLRPASSGVDVIVRYMTKAEERFATRNRIYQTVIDLLRKNEEAATLEAVANK